MGEMEGGSKCKKERGKKEIKGREKQTLTRKTLPTKAPNEISAMSTKSRFK